jgi:membrane-bound lytic murein transglycosylase
MENCPRCDFEIAKSKFQTHMEKSHKIIANFKQMTKRSFQPNLAENEIIKEKISKFSEQEDFPKKEINSKSTAKNNKIQKDFAEIETDLNAKREIAVEVMRSQTKEICETKKAATKKGKVPIPTVKKDVVKKEKNPKPKKNAKKDETEKAKDLKISLQNLTEVCTTYNLNLCP